MDQRWKPGPRFLALIAAGTLGVMAPGCGHDERAGPGRVAERPPTAVELAPVRIGAAERFIDVSGTLFGEEETVVSSKLSGRVVEVLHDVGDVVEPGSVLARQETADYELRLAESRALLQASLAKLGLKELPGEGFDLSEVPTVERARAEAANAEARFRRAVQLFQEVPPLISEQEFNDAVTRRDVARSDADVALLNAQAVLAEARTQAAVVALAEQRLADTAIRAPAGPDGKGPTYRVAERLVSLGEYLTEGKPVFRLVAAELIKFRAEVPERFVGQVREGQEARVWMEAYREPFAGKVARISPSINPTTRTFRIEVHVPNPEGLLRPGAFARGRIVVARDEGVTFVPSSAVVTFAGVRRVFSVQDGKAVEHRVELGVEDGGFVEIRGGLPVDQVVTTGAAALANGVPVVVGGS